MNKLTQTAKKYMIPFGRYHSFNGLRDEALVQSKYDVIEPQLPHFRMFFFIYYNVYPLLCRRVLELSESKILSPVVNMAQS